jgi:hypothetical protein
MVMTADPRTPEQIAAERYPHYECAGISDDSDARRAGFVAGWQAAIAPERAEMLATADEAASFLKEWDSNAARANDHDGWCWDEFKHHHDSLKALAARLRTPADTGKGG